MLYTHVYIIYKEKVRNTHHVLSNLEETKTTKGEYEVSETNCGQLKKKDSKSCDMLLNYQVSKFLKRNSCKTLIGESNIVYDTHPFRHSRANS